MENYLCISHTQLSSPRLAAHLAPCIRLSRKTLRRKYPTVSVQKEEPYAILCRSPLLCHLNHQPFGTRVPNRRSRRRTSSIADPDRQLLIHVTERLAIMEAVAEAILEESL